MRHRVFVYGTLLAGEVNHCLLAGNPLLGSWRTPPRFTLYDLGAYPGVARSGCTSIVGEVYAIDTRCLGRLDTLEEYPRLYDRERIPTLYGSAWIYLYRGRLADLRAIPGGDWRTRASTRDSSRAAGVRGSWNPNRSPWTLKPTGQFNGI
jgi:gamma-glutamylaminecyclotransferase